MKATDLLNKDIQALSDNEMENISGGSVDWGNPGLIDKYIFVCEVDHNHRFYNDSPSPCYCTICNFHMNSPKGYLLTNGFEVW